MTLPACRTTCSKQKSLKHIMLACPVDQTQNTKLAIWSCCPLQTAGMSTKKKEKGGPLSFSPGGMALSRSLMFTQKHQVILSTFLPMRTPCIMHWKSKLIMQTTQNCSLTMNYSNLAPSPLPMDLKSTLSAKSLMFAAMAVTGSFSYAGMDMAPNTTFGWPLINLLTARHSMCGIRMGVMGQTYSSFSLRVLP